MRGRITNPALWGSQSWPQLAFSRLLPPARPPLSPARDVPKGIVSHAYERECFGAIIGNMIRSLAPLALALCLPLLPKTPMQQVQVVTTDRVDFAAGGTIRLGGAGGGVNMKGGSRPR